jgi:hypothetical protein
MYVIFDQLNNENAPENYLVEGFDTLEEAVEQYSALAWEADAESLLVTTGVIIRDGHTVAIAYYTPTTEQPLLNWLLIETGEKRAYKYVPSGRSYVAERI